MGRYTKALRSLQPGTPAAVTGPFGHFFFDPQKVSRVMMLTGGIGITPFVSMITTAADKSWATDLTLIASHRSPTEAPYLPEISRAEAQNPHFRSFVGFSAQKIDQPTERQFNGVITAEVVGRALTAEPWSYLWMLCGPGPFMRAMRMMLVSLGVPDRQIVAEEFAVAPPTLLERGTTTPKLVFAGYALAALTAFGFIWKVQSEKREHQTIPAVYDQAVINSIQQQAATYTQNQQAVATTPSTVTPTPTTSGQTTNTPTTTPTTNTTTQPTQVTPTPTPAPIYIPVQPRTRLS